jgi:phosphoglycolate phosphatase-like HAD superfamily hydrolase
MALTLTLEGDSELIAASMNAFARAHGWTEESEITQSEHSANVIKAFLRESITAYTSNQAAEAARQAAIAQSTAAADMLTITLTEA